MEWNPYCSVCDLNFCDDNSLEQENTIKNFYLKIKICKYCLNEMYNLA